MTRAYALFICFMALHCALAANLYVEENNCCPTPPCVSACPLPYCNDVEFRVGYFYPTAKRFREIFEGARIFYAIEGSHYFNLNLAIWGNVSWFSKSGTSDGGHHHTRVNLLPINLGLKYVYWINCNIRCGLGLGVNYFILNTEDHGCCCIRKRTSHRQFGGTLKSDIQYLFCSNLYASLFVDYLYLPLHSSALKQAGGIQTGLGLGYQF